MQTLAGILTLVAGVIFPMAMLAWLAFRMNKKPPLSSDRVGMILAFNGVLPIGLVLVGLGLMAPSIWALGWVRIAAYFALGVAGIILISLLVRGVTGSASHREKG